jgi:hypothetical protein
VRHGRCTGILAIAFIGWFGSAVSASSISYGVSTPDLPGGGYFAFESIEATGIDLSKGGTYSLPSYSLYGYPNIWNSQANTIAPGSVIGVWFTPSGGSPGGPQFNDPLVSVVVPITGDIRQVGPERAGGYYFGTGASAMLEIAGTPPVLPPEVADLLAHPDRIHLDGFVNGGTNNIMNNELRINPYKPNPVPEPSMLAVFAVSVGGMTALLRGRKSRPHAR